MKYNSYIKDTTKVSEIGLGAWQLGQNSGWKSMSEKDAIHLIETAIDYGVNFFDTAPNYGHGSGEERLGKALKITDRSKVVINTKFGHTHTGITNYKASYIRESLEGSLKRLQVDYVDSLIIHNPPSSYLDGYKNDHYERLETLIEEGKIKAYGASVDTYQDMKQLINTTNAKVIEAFFNILHQDMARGFDLAKEKDVAIIAKIPLDSGWLSGKYNKNSNFKGIRSRWSKKDIETRAQLLEKIKTILGEDTNLTQKALSFCLSYDAVSTVIPGNANCNQLKTNLESVNYPLSKNTINELEQFYHTEVKPLNLPW